MRLTLDEVNTLSLLLERIPRRNSRQEALLLRCRRRFRRHFSTTKEIVFEPDFSFLDEDLRDHREDENGDHR